MRSPSRKLFFIAVLLDSQHSFGENFVQFPHFG